MVTICAMAASGPQAGFIPLLLITGKGRKRSVRKEKQLIFSGESRGRVLGLMHKDASPALGTSNSVSLMSHFLWDRSWQQGSWHCKVPSDPH